MIELQMANEMKAYVEGLFDLDMSCVRFMAGIGTNTDACAQCFVYGDTESGELEYIRIVLYIDEMKENAEYEGMEYDDYIRECVFHELIHAMHAIVYTGTPIMQEMCETHEGEFWDDLVEVGMSAGLITREAI